MVPIARRNLFHDKVKLATALVGVFFSVLLVACLGGLFVGASRNATDVITNAGADLWITSRGTRSIDLGEPISKRRLYQTLATPGVLWAEPLVIQFSQWRLADGRQEIAQVVGVEQDSRLNLPWSMAAGKRDYIRHDGGVIIDARERRRFGTADRPLQIGDRVEILNTRARVAGFSAGVGSITTIPYVFTTRTQAERFTLLDSGLTKFVVVKAAPHIKPADLQQRLAARMPDVDVHTAQELSAMTLNYWLFGTGVGMGIIFAATLGLIVGSVIVSQTIYASTMNRLTEYATLKAVGMDNRQLGIIILRQALLIGLIGYGLGAAAAWLLSRYLPDLNMPVDIPPWLYAALLLTTLATCAASSITSVVKVFRLPPASVFRG